MATDLDGFFESAWVTALIKTNSTNFRILGETGGLENVKTFGHYLKHSPNGIISGVDFEAKDSEKLKKLYVMEGMLDRTGRGDDGKVDLLVDKNGHDIAMIYIRDQNLVVEVSPEILKNNLKMLNMASISNNGQSLEVGNIEELEKIMKPDSLKKIVEQVEKYDSVKMRSREDARERVKDLGEEEKEKAELSGDLNKNRESTELNKEENKNENELNQDEIEEEAQEQGFDSSNIDQIVKICQENGLRPEDIKQSLTLVNPNNIIDDIDNRRTNVRPNGGEVFILRFKNKEASAGPDRIYMIQDGQLLPRDENNDAKVSELLEQHKGNNQKVNDIYDNRQEEVLQEIIAIQLEFQEKIDMIQSSNADNKQEMIERITAVTTDKINELVAGYKPAVTNQKEIGDTANKEVTNEGKKAEEIVLEEEPENTTNEEHDDDDWKGPWEVPGKRTH